MIAEAQIQQFVVINVHAFSLVLPQEDIVSIEPTAELIQLDTQDETIGRIQYQGESVSVYAVDEYFQSAREIDKEDRLVVVLRGSDTLYGLVAKSARAYAADETVAKVDLPAFMRKDSTIISAIGRSANDDFYQFSAGPIIESHLNHEEANCE